MRKAVLAAVLSAVAVGPLNADILEITPHAGYTSVSMGQFNHYNDVMWGWDGDGYNRVLSSAYVVGLDVTTHRLTPWEWLDLGVRGEYLDTNLGEMNEPSAQLDYTDQGSLSSAEVGATVDAPTSLGGLHLGLGAWIGAGYGTMEQNVRLNTNKSPAAPVSDGLFTATNLVGELEGSLKYMITPKLSLSFTGGWRWADMGVMKSHGTPLTEMENTWLEWTNNPVNVDFSGVTAQGALTYGF